MSEYEISEMRRQRLLVVACAMTTQTSAAWGAVVVIGAAQLVRLIRALFSRA